MPSAAFLLLYGCFLAGFGATLVLVNYQFFWKPFHRRLAETRAPSRPLVPPRHVDAATMRRVGSLRGDRRSSFPNFTLRKPDGAIRICAFGDSWTYGAEVVDGHDYPAFLQQMFLERGVRNVEVLNFGNSWHGFHQSYMIWEAVGRRFDCDVVLLGPRSFQPVRDSTFNHSGFAYPYYLHARYILDGPGLRLIEVLGNTHQERFAEYFAFRPRLQYLRYDRHAPAFLQALMPAGWSLPNPFYYYRGQTNDEVHATYRLLLEALAREPVQILLLHRLDAIVELANDAKSENLVGVQAEALRRFPYHAPSGHHSSIGNQWIAEHYFSLLVIGGPPPSVIEFEDLPPDAEAAAVRDSPPAAPISSYASLHLAAGGARVGYLAVADGSARRGGATDFAGSDTAGLLALVPEGRSIVDAAFLTTSALPRAGDPLVLRHGRGASARDTALGTVRLLAAEVAIGIVEVPGLTVSDGGEISLSTAGTDGRGRVSEVSLAENALLRATPSDTHLRLEPLAGKVRRFRVAAGDYVRVDQLPEDGTAMLVLTGAKSTVEVPLARWRRQSDAVLPATRHLPRRLVLDGDRAALEPAPPRPTERRAFPAHSSAALHRRRTTQTRATSPRAEAAHQRPHDDRAQRTRLCLTEVHSETRSSPMSGAGREALRLEFSRRPHSSGSPNCTSVFVWTARSSSAGRIRAASVSS